ncbi:MAG: NAD-dependent epimerase/dehydratase family protein [Sedimenticola thiotaurini]|uniref:NAD-dependent epimerase/dehydratase family protein n=1 Tax=Sedimenticola thiotaurini TaxID=1543721 RepID=A0A558CE77_9GAMM|nr:MAG: NAD-dependent epimerase/dehydratase family protein [Sedimenticola thiotaurini]
MESMKPNVLVIGASGQLGGAILRRIAIDRDIAATAFVRSDSNFESPDAVNISRHTGDLTDFESVNAACGKNISHVIATASSIVPRKGDSFGADDLLFYENIIRACRENHVRHLIYISAFPSPFDDQVPEFVIKRQIEQMIVASGVPYTIFRGAAFMDIYFAVMGSRAVIQGVGHPTLLRGYWLSRLWSSLTSGILEKYGIALVPGNGKTRQSFICIDDVANCMLAAVNQPTLINQIIDLGGLQAVSWREVADLYGHLLNKRVIKIPLPIWLLKSLEMLMRKSTPAGANMMSILALLGHYEFAPDMSQLTNQLQIELSDSRSFIARKLTESKL